MYVQTMPLIRSGSRAAVGANIREMEAAGHSRAQSIAAALNNARQYGGKFASGGAPFGERMAARSLYHEGFLHSSVPGRTDKLPITVEGGAYVVPSSHVAAIGQDNSLSGAAILDKMFKSGPYGSARSGIHSIKSPRPSLHLNAKAHFASGGTPTGNPVSIIAAGGEYVIPPRAIIEKYGSLEKGHKALDHWIVTRRKKHAKTIAKLAPPRKD